MKTGFVQHASSLPVRGLTVGVECECQHPTFRQWTWGDRVITWKWDWFDPSAASLCGCHPVCQLTGGQRGQSTLRLLPF